jgi:NAD(P)-dependent dehydrogenase (short-subunit alcohol dehydrogenase family)
MPSREDFETALDVLDFCIKSQEFDGVNLRTSSEDLVRVLNNYLHSKKLENEIHSTNSTSQLMQRSTEEKKCYTCQYLLVSRHPQYHSLCKQCGDFNLASSGLSLLEIFHLHGRTALVTGARIHLGYHTALRLLRCGAKVIVTSRYPCDAATRYLSEQDSESWHERLRIVGADFRAASDVFYLVDVVKKQLGEWHQKGKGKLDILINNAAQTWTDSLETERKAVQREEQLTLEGAKDRLLLIDSSYQPRARGEIPNSRMLEFGFKEDRSLRSALVTSTDACTTLAQQSEEDTLSTKPADSKTSWMQSIYEIPYEDVITAHSVNTFVPFILVRELLPLMGSPRSQVDSQPKIQTSKPEAYIINVSAREGAFEPRPDHWNKNGRHVHTNLAKAALNMLTETEAQPAWRHRKVAMNSVDPGYLSAAPEILESWKRQGREEGCPIGWEDGAGRVLWPIVMGEKGNIVRGRFLKHFEIDLVVGR